MTADFRSSLLRAWAHQRDYTERLVADLTPEIVFREPPGGEVMNHPAWLLCHLSVYSPVLVEMLTGGSPEDPIEHRYGRKSAPTLTQGAYPAWDDIGAQYFAVHDLVGPAFNGATAELLEAPPTIERFRARWPHLQDVVVHLMVHHESVHLGQLSAWRRVCGLPPV